MSNGFMSQIVNLSKSKRTAKKFQASKKPTQASQLKRRNRQGSNEGITNHNISEDDQQDGTTTKKKMSVRQKVTGIS